MGNITTNAIYIWTSCVRNDTSIGNNMRCVIETREQCNNEEEVYPIFNVSVWLYPFSIEFNILIVAVWFILWTSIGNIQDHKESLEFLPSITPQGSMENLHRIEGHKQASTLFADCTSSNGGMFVGILSIIGVTAACVVLLTMNECDYDSNQLISNLLRIVVFTILIVASVYAYYIVACLEVNPQPISLLDDLLLFFCLPAFFLYVMVWMAPLIHQSLDGDVHPDAMIASLLFFLQPLIQTPMIVDGLRRCTNDPAVMKKMPGRNVITFLIVGNLATYLMETLLFKNYDSQTDKIDFYGADAWTVLGHITIPITIFYRFHSAVALVDIWNSAYKPPENHH